MSQAIDISSLPVEQLANIIKQMEEVDKIFKVKIFFSVPNILRKSNTYKTLILN